MTDGADELRRAVEQAQRHAAQAEASERLNHESRARSEEEAERVRAELDRASASAITAFLKTMHGAGNPGARPCRAERQYVPGTRAIGQGWIITPAKITRQVDPSMITQGIALLTDGRALEHDSYPGRARDRHIVLTTRRGGLVPVTPSRVKVDRLATILIQHGLAL